MCQIYLGASENCGFLDPNLGMKSALFSKHSMVIPEFPFVTHKFQSLVSHIHNYFVSFV